MSFRSPFLICFSSFPFKKKDDSIVPIRNRSKRSPIKPPTM